MSDESIITLATLIIGFLGMLAKLHYGEKKVEGKVDATSKKAEVAAEKAAVVEQKIDDNTKLTKKIDGQTNGGLDDRFATHAARIAALEAKFTGMESKLVSMDAKQDSMAKDVTSSRHEMRGHFQTVSNALMLLTGRGAIPLPLNPVTPPNSGSQENKS